MIELDENGLETFLIAWRKWDGPNVFFSWDGFDRDIERSLQFYGYAIIHVVTGGHVGGGPGIQQMFICPDGCQLPRSLDTYGKVIDTITVRPNAPEPIEVEKPKGRRIWLGE